MTDRLAELERHVEWLTKAIESIDAKGSEIASLIRERRLTLDAIAALPAEAEGTSVADQLAAKRQDRLTAAGVDPHASRRGQSRRSGRVHPAS
jgi:hypothetical protein